MADSLTLQQRLHCPYDRDDWQEILHEIFPDGTVRLFSSPQTLAATQDNVKATRQLGTIELADGNSIALLEVETSNQVKLTRNRVGLRNFVSGFIDEAGAAAVLAVFHQDGSPDWRLTYASRQTTLDEDTFEITTIETAPRRFTFLLGENETCRTAAARLAGIEDKGDELVLPDVEKAFSVETLTKDFFKKYKEHYQAFVDHLLSEAEGTRESFGVAELEDEEEQEKADKPIRDFVKTLLGRLVFLHFLQKKGWLGCPAGGKKWKGGDQDFLQSFLRFAIEKGDAEFFHSKYLCPLFFEALNTPDRPGDLFPLNGTRLPYLNGGLFEEDGDEQRGIEFPVELFRGLLDFFGEYNFTIDENDPEDHEVGIDPEMLGHIFENLLEDNKDKGAYYTPKAIVSYMARQSLLHYLQTHLGENEELETLLNEKDLAKHPEGSFVAENKQAVVERLEEVKICDPAIGSGAFPIGLLQEILWTRLALQPELNTPAERAELKRQIIQHSIHGVDIDPGAIEIARLRFWLALVVDEDEPRPLPNLEYKIHRADSLIEYIRGEPVNLGTEPPTDAGTKAAVGKLIAAKRALFTAQRLPEKRAAWFDLYRALAEVAQTEFTWLRNETNFADAERMAVLDTGIREFGQWIGKVDGIRKQKVHHQETLLAQLRDWFDDPQNPTFLWNLHFGEVFANGGFDVVIANPPYLLLQDGVGENWYKEALSTKYTECVGYKVDLYHAFIGLISQMCRGSGISCYITPSNFRTNNYCPGMRRYLVANFAIDQIVVFSEKVFNANVNNLLFLAKRTLPAAAHKVLFCQCTELASLARKSFPKEESVQRIYGDGRPLLPVSSGESELIDRIEGESTPLGKLATVSFGMQLRDRREFPQDVIKPNSGERPTSEHKMCLTGRNIDRYRITYTDLYCFFNRAAKRGGCWNEKQHLTKGKILTPQIGRIPNFAIDVEGRPILNTAFMIICKAANPKFVVAILNSKVTAFYWIAQFSDDRKQFPKVKGTYLKNLPIPEVNPEEEARLSELADACAAAAQRDDSASLVALEGEIDQIVYRLFKLKPEEIALIGSSLDS